MTKAVVFAYHNVGVRCLKVLLAHRVDVSLVVTHEDKATETIWFDSVKSLALSESLPVITPADPNSAEVVEAVAALGPDFLFSFYYRHLLKSPLLSLPSRGAFNMHGSLLPHYRGRVPVNWAVLHGEQETGATLHKMDVKPDSGPIVDQCAVPILPNDTAAEVFAKVVLAAEIVLWRSVPRLIEGCAHFIEQDKAQGQYFGGRKPEDGRIDPQMLAPALHNFVRALTRPFPGAFSQGAWGRLFLWQTRLLPMNPSLVLPPTQAQMSVLYGALTITTVEGGRLLVLDAQLNGQALTADSFSQLCGPEAVLFL